MFEVMIGVRKRVFFHFFFSSRATLVEGESEGRKRLCVDCHFSDGFCVLWRVLFMNSHTSSFDANLFRDRRRM